MVTVDSTSNGPRTIVVDVDDSDFAACSLMVCVEGASILVHLDSEQAMSVGSALCAKALVGRDLPVEYGDWMPGGFDAAHDAQLGSGMAGDDSRFDGATGESRR